MGNIAWTKGWSSADDGTILAGADLQNIQNDITAVINGGISNVNVASDAAIGESKIDFDDTSGHDHDGSNSTAIAIADLSDVTITTLENGQVLAYDSGDEVFKNVAPVIPIGMTLPWITSTAPDGFLLCDGSAVSRTTYAALFALAGETFGAGDGVSTFNVPDLRGRGVVGVDNMGGTSADRLTGAWADTLGGADGDEEHTLLVAEMPAHTHSFIIKGGSSFLGGIIDTVGSTSDSFDTDSAGGDGAHNNVQPSIAMYWVIKT